MKSHMSVLLEQGDGLTVSRLECKSILRTTTALAAMALLATFLITLPKPASAQTETVLHRRKPMTV
jgi:hypothetical protein